MTRSQSRRLTLAKSAAELQVALDRTLGRIRRNMTSSCPAPCTCVRCQKLSNDLSSSDRNMVTALPRPFPCRPFAHSDQRSPFRKIISRRPSALEIAEKVGPDPLIVTHVSRDIVPGLDLIRKKIEETKQAAEKPDLVYLGQLEKSGSYASIRVWHDSRGNTLFDCVCGNKKPTPSLTSMKHHIHWHSSSLKPCPVCRKEFPNHWSLNAHMKVHKGEECFKLKFSKFSDASASSTSLFPTSHEIPNSNELARMMDPSAPEVDDDKLSSSRFRHMSASTAESE